jgi:hypothetical protein
MTDTTHNIEAGVFGAMHPVEVVGTVDLKHDVYTRPQCAEFGSFATYTFTGTETQPVPICGRDQYRSRMIVLVSVAGAAGFVNIGTLNQFATPTNIRGGRLFNNANIEIKNQQQFFILPDGTNAATVTVLVERYDAYPDEPIITTATNEGDL